MGLIAAELERYGIATVAIQSLRKVAEKIRPPRALVVPFAQGYPLDAPGDSAKQHAVIEAAFKLLEDQHLQPPVIVDYIPA